ncbi:MAG: hypothetical protein JWO67_3694 [Streptosporangiaceae bacterium]|jgi:hypothetical protein|nr:hypothetical protein [Streptosporangiaceae bacterium]
MPDWMLPAELPPGRWVLPDAGHRQVEGVYQPVMWVSDEPVAGVSQHWSRLYADHRRTGLYPFLLASLAGDPDRPWHSGELTPFPASMIDAMDVECFLRRSWDLHMPGVPWQGLAPATPLCQDPGVAASAVAASCAARAGHGARWFLGLVPAVCGAEALCVCGWSVPTHRAGDILEIAAVLRSWEERFGARVVAVGYDTLDLALAAPPATREQARSLAAELIAFCPTGFSGYTIGDLVDGIEMPDGSVVGSIVAQTHMAFWWAC